MSQPEEKLLLKVRGKPMISYVLDALKGSRCIDRIIVAVSKHTPKTAKWVRRLSFEIFETPGLDFVSDMRFAVKHLGLSEVLVISADLPLVSSRFIEEVIGRYRECGKPSLCVMAAKASCMKAEGEVGHKGSTLIPTGINVIDGERIDEPELEQENFVTGAMDVAVNVNTLGDLQRAEFLLEQAEKEQRRFRRAVNKRRDNTRRF